MEIQWATIVFLVVFWFVGLALGIWLGYSSARTEKAGQDLARQELRVLAKVAASYSMGYPALIAAVNRAGDFLGMERRHGQ